MSTHTSQQRTIVDVPSIPIPSELPTSAAVVAGPFVFTASMSASDWKTGVAADAQPESGLPYSSENPVLLETRKIYERLGAALEAGGSSFESTVQINQWLASYHGNVERHAYDRNQQELFWEKWRSVITPYLAGRNEFILKDRPASCAMPVDRLLTASSSVEVEIVGLTKASGITKRAYEHDVHMPLGGYSIGVESGPFLFTAGFIPTDFKTGDAPGVAVPDHIWYGNRVANETAETLRQLRVTVEAGNAEWRNTVKATIYVTPFALKNLPAIDQVFKDFWPDRPPARAVVPTTGIGGLKNGNVEIYLTVARPDQGGDIEVIETGKALPSLGYAPQAIKSAGFVFMSTQQGRDVGGCQPSTRVDNEEFPFLNRSIRNQMHALAENTHAICEAAGGSIEDLVKADLHFNDFQDLTSGLDVWKRSFTRGYPASGFFEEFPDLNEVPGCRITADLVAYCA